MRKNRFLIMMCFSWLLVASEKSSLIHQESQEYLNSSLYQIDTEMIELEKFMKTYERNSRIYPTKEFEFYFDVGNEMYESKNYLLAKVYYSYFIGSIGLKYDENHKKVLYRLGYLCELLHSFDEAENYYEKYLSLMMEEKKKKNYEIKKISKKLIQLYTDDKRIDQLIDLMHRVVSAPLSDSTQIHIVASLSEHTKIKKVKDFITAWLEVKTLKRVVSDIGAQSNYFLAEIARNVNEDNLAVDAYKEAIRKSTKESAWYNLSRLGIGKIYEQRGKRKLAIESYREISKTSSAYHEACFSLFKIMVELEDYEQAIAIALKNQKKILTLFITEILIV